MSSDQPSFDCRKARMPIERLVCSDAELAVLDRQLAREYQRVVGSDSLLTKAEQRAERIAQRAWLVQRNACPAKAFTTTCVADGYRQRIVALQIASGQRTPTTRATYRCLAHAGEIVSAAYFDTEPAAVRLALGARTTTAFATRAASGARYTANAVDWWEHQREVRLRWFGRQLVCAPD